MFFWDVVVVVVEGCPCGPFCITFTIGDLPVALYSFVFLRTAAEEIPSILLFPDVLPRSQVHRDYS